MSKLNHIHQADLEDLNAYLDGALSEKEKAIFQLKLAKSLPLQATLREHTFLRNALRSVPPRKAPRHFTLTTEEARALKPRFTFAPLFSLASMVSLMFLGILFASEWIFKNVSAPPAKQADAVVMNESAEAMPAVPQEHTAIEAKTDAPLLFNWGQGYAGGLGGGMGDGAVPMSSGMAIFDSSHNPMIINSALQPEYEISAEQPLSVTAEMMPAESAVPVPEERPLRMSAPAEKPAGYTGAIIWGLRPADEGKVLQVYPPMLASSAQPVNNQTEAETASVPAKGKDSLSAIVFEPWVKYLLGALTLIFGVTAYVLTRRFNRTF